MGAFRTQMNRGRDSLSLFFVTSVIQTSGNLISLRKILRKDFLLSPPQLSKCCADTEILYSLEFVLFSQLFSVPGGDWKRIKGILGTVNIRVSLSAVCANILNSTLQLTHFRTGNFYNRYFYLSKVQPEATLEKLQTICHCFKSCSKRKRVYLHSPRKKKRKLNFVNILCSLQLLV